MSKNVIRDGQTVNAYLRGVDRLHDELRFSFRPMLAEQVEATELQAAKEKNAIASAKVIAAAIAGQLTEWSEVGVGNVGEPINIDSVRRLQPALLNKLYRVVTGRDPYDLPPGAGENTPDEQDDFTRQLMNRAKGVDPVEAVAKN